MLYEERLSLRKSGGILQFEGIDREECPLVIQVYNLLAKVGHESTVLILNPLIALSPVF